ncbi:MAG: glycine--tRNA ligase, partial [Alphaproteobacteria bacterium]|nr:glycine--tRNA ligase [Alphaproteobacteria bacterium]
MPQPETSLMNRLVSLCKRRGFVFPASEIYGGLNGFWDFGPNGVLLKNNLRDAWWRDMVLSPPLGPDGEPLSIVGIDTSIIQHPKTWEASGHINGFSDPMRKCSGCGHFVRGDHLWDILARESEWLSSLLQEFTPVTGGIDTPRLLKWARGKGKKLAPNLALVKNPEVTLSFLATRINGQPEAPPEMMELVRYLATAQVHETGLQDPCPLCGAPLGEPEAFTLMFESYTGIEKSNANKVYLRPETAQGIFLQFKNVLDTSRVKPPFGIAQVGKSFRNEITPRNFIFRTREFEQMEMEFFVPPEDGMKWYEFWVAERLRWWEEQGVSKANLFRHEIPEADRSFYSSATSDIEYKYPFTDPNFGELEGVAYRTDYDLKQHQSFSKQNLEYIDQEAKTRYLPHVIEPASGLTRGVLVLLSEAYQYDESRASPEWLKLKPSLAPTKLGIFPLVNKDGMPEIAEKLYLDLRKTHTCQYDAKQSIGKRYARMDEAGTPYCITIDGETAASQSVTIRDRDTAQQERVALDKIKDYVGVKLAG